MSTSIPCPKCSGKGVIQIKRKTKCPRCRGLGGKKLVIGEKKPTGKNICSECQGSGQILTTTEKDCPSCQGKGTKQHLCPLCKNPSSPEKLCNDCERDLVVFQLTPPVSTKMVEFDKIFSSKVVKKVDFGFFIQLAPKLEGLVRNKHFRGKEGDQVYVKLKNIKGEKLEFNQVKIPNYFRNSMNIKKLHDPVPFQKIQMEREVGTFLSFHARVESIRQIPRGPKVFTLLDETGIIEAAAFQRDFENDIEVGDIVEVIGEYTIHRDSEQIEISDIFVVEKAYADSFQRKMEKFLDKRSQPSKIDFLVSSEPFKLLKPKFVSVAKRIRRAMIELQPIIIRHHADCDGIIAGISLEIALRDLWIQLYGQLDEEKLRHIVKRTVNKPPFYDPLDAVRDLDFALTDQNRFGDKLPIIVILDTGSSIESIFSYKLLKTYGIEIYVVDHHFPDSTVQEVVDTHLNVYFAGGDYNICAGMLGVELARFVNSNPKITERINHLPAIAGVGDRVEGYEFNQYLELAENKEYSKGFLKEIAIAVDYQAYFLKFSPGRHLLSDLLGLDVKHEIQMNFVKLLSLEARSHLENQLKISLEYVQEDILPNMINLSVLDVEKYTSRFDYPPPGRITGSLFDHLAKKNPKSALVTIGLGPDFAIFRSQNVRLDFPQLVKNCAKRAPHAGVEGGGHEIVGSMKFITGAREEIMEIIQELLTLIEI